MNKFLLSLAGASVISLTGTYATNLQPNYAQASSITFPKEVQGKWTSQNGDAFKIKDSKATLNIANGKKKGTYKFKLKSKTNDSFKLKIDGKKFNKTQDYSLSTVQNRTMKFTYGKKTMQFNNENVKSDGNKTNSTSQAKGNVSSNNTNSPNQPTEEWAGENAVAARTGQGLSNYDRYLAERYHYNPVSGTYEGTPEEQAQGKALAEQDQSNWNDEQNKSYVTNADDSQAMAEKDAAYAEMDNENQ